MASTGPGEEPTVLRLLLSAVEDVKDMVVRLQVDLTSRFDSLDAKFLPRSEYEARHSDLRNQATRTDARVDAEAAARESLDEHMDAALKSLGERVTQGQRWALGTAITGGLLLIAIIGLIVAHK